jgi:HEAT repeat protein
MRALLLLPLLAGVAAAGEAWRFSFENGDLVHGDLVGVRGASVLVEMAASPRAVAVPFARISEAAPDGDEETTGGEQILRLTDGSALLGRCRAIRAGHLEFETEPLGLVKVPAGEIAELLTPEDALRAYRDAMATRTRLATKPLTAERFDALWANLGDPDGNVAWRAHRELSRAGADAVRRLDARMREPPDGPEAVLREIRNLDDRSADVRALAYVHLRSLGAAATLQLSDAVRDSASTEVRHRAISLLALKDDEPGPTPEVLCFVRAIRVLEEIGTPEARAILERIATSAPGAPTGREAEAALERLRRIR